MTPDSNSISGSEAKKISLVVPMYNEEANIRLFYEDVSKVLDNLECTWEVVCVNDGSKDNTLAQLVQLNQSDARVKVIDFSRNFGKELALSAGIDFATGHAVIPIDADLQHPPEVIGEMLDKWKDGADIVFGVRRSREKESLPKRLLSKIFYKLFGKISGIPNHNRIGDFCLLDAKVADIIRKLPEKNRFMKGLFAWVGYNKAYVIFDLQDRNAGHTKWNYWRLWNFALDGITSFSTIPLRIWTYVGFTIATLSILYAGKVIFHALAHDIDVPGYASLMVALLFLGGIQLISLGIIGEYLGRIYIEVKGRPKYLIRESYGFDSSSNCIRSENTAKLE